MRANLLIRGVDIDVLCPCCLLCPEDVNHFCWYCHFARKLWKMSAIWHCLSDFSRGGFGDIFQWVYERGKVNNLEVL